MGWEVPLGDGLWSEGRNIYDYDLGDKRLSNVATNGYWM